MRGAVSMGMWEVEGCDEVRDAVGMGRYLCGRWERVSCVYL